MKNLDEWLKVIEQRIRWGVGVNRLKTTSVSVAMMGIDSDDIAIS